MTLGGKSSGLREAQRLAVGIARCLIRWKKRHVSGLDSPASPLEAWGFLLPAGLFCALRAGDALVAILNVWGWIIRGAGKRTAFLRLPGFQGPFRTRLQHELALSCQQIFEPDSLKFRNIKASATCHTDHEQTNWRNVGDALDNRRFALPEQLQTICRIRSGSEAATRAGRQRRWQLSTTVWPGSC